MENTSGRTSFLPNYGYFVSTLNDEEDDDNFEYGYRNYLRQDKEKTCIKSTWSPNVEKNNSINIFELHSSNMSNRMFRTSTNKSNEITYQEDYNDGFHNLENMFFSQSQSKRSKACIEASNYSLQQSLELLMGKSKHQELYEHSIDSPYGACKEPMQSIVKKSIKVGDRKMQQKIIEPIREVATSKVKVEPLHLEVQYEQAKMEHIQITSNVAYNLNDYLNPVDMEPYYNKSQKTLPIEAKRLKLKVRNNQYKEISNCATSNLQLVDWRNDILKEDKNIYFDEFSSRQPHKVRNDLNKASIIHLSQNITYSRAKIASQKMKQVFQHLRLLWQIKKESQQKHSIYVNSTMLKNHDLVRNCCRVVEKSCLEKKHLDDFFKKTHDSNDDQVIHQKTNLEAFCDQKNERIKSKKKLSSLVNPKVLKYKNYDWASSKTKVSHSHGSSKLKMHLANQSEHEDHRNTFWNFEPIEKIQATIQSKNMVSNDKKIVQVNLIDFNTDFDTNISSTLLEKNLSNCIMAPAEENATLDISKKIKIGISSNQKVKDQILSTLNSSRRIHQTTHKISQDTAYYLDENKQALDLESPCSNLLHEQKFETLNVIDYKSLETDGRTMSKIKDPYKFDINDINNINDDKRIECNASFSFDVDTVLENSQIKIKPWKTKGEKENIGQTKIKGIPSNPKENEDTKNKKLPTLSSTIEDQRLQASIYDPNEQEDNVYKPKLFVENNSIDKSQVYNKAQEPYNELHLQNIKLLKLPQDLQFQHQTFKICNKKIEGMMDPTFQYGYLAQYLKTKKMGEQRNNHLLTLHK